MTLIVCPLDAVETVSRRAAPSHLLTLIGPDQAAPAPPPGADHLVLRFHDVPAARDGLVAADADAVAALLAFAGSWRPDRPMLVHCWFGVSRSPAAAYAILCARHPDVAESDIAARLRRAMPWATPNPLLVALADTALGRGGRMGRAIAAIGRGEGLFAGEEVRFELAAGAAAVGVGERAPRC